MVYNAIGADFLCVCTYGSRLYGTSTPTSDYDYKIIYLPTIQDLLLGKKLDVRRHKFNAVGERISDGKAMSENGYESEHIPVQKFVHEYLSGQAYAVELVFAIMQDAITDWPPVDSGNFKRFVAFADLCKILGTQFVHLNLYGMTGFAKKQVFDYISRGERLNAAKRVLTFVDDLQSPAGTMTLRLDSYIGVYVLDLIAEATGIKIVEVENNNKKMRALELNGRTYLETTAVTHFKAAVQKLVDQYGDRSTNAAETAVDYKSLSHAVRVYQQVLELLEHKTISFPRPNAKELLKIKMGEVNLDEVKVLLKDLDDKVNHALQTSVLPAVDKEFTDKVNEMLFLWLKELY